MNSSSKRASSIPCGCSFGENSFIRSTTFTTRTRRSGAFARSHAAAATVSSVATSPAQARITSGSPSPAVLHQSHTDAPRAQCSRAAARSVHCSCGCLSMIIKFTYPALRRQWSATESRQFASGGK